MAELLQLPTPGSMTTYNGLLVITRLLPTKLKSIFNMSKKLSSLKKKYLKLMDRVLQYMCIPTPIIEGRAFSFLEKSSSSMK